MAASSDETTAALSERAPRKDAVRNRALLVDAAVEAFRLEGLGVSVNAIADRAGVNVATLYRHFPTKDDLVAGVIDAILEPMAAARDRALEEGEGGRELEVFVRESLKLQQDYRGLVDLLTNQLAQENVRERLREPSLEIVRPLVARAHESGELREDFDEDDLLLALRMVSVTAGVGKAAGEPERYAGVVLRGLRSG